MYSCVQVTKSSPEEFNKWTGIQDSMGGGGGGGTGGGGHGGVFIARLQGLPYRVTEEEIVSGEGRGEVGEGGVGVALHSH